MVLCSAKPPRRRPSFFILFSCEWQVGGSRRVVEMLALELSSRCEIIIFFPLSLLLQFLSFISPLFCELHLSPSTTCALFFFSFPHLSPAFCPLCSLPPHGLFSSFPAWLPSLSVSFPNPPILLLLPSTRTQFQPPSPFCPAPRFSCRFRSFGVRAKLWKHK